ncbi:MAG: hypothetical protein K9H41_01970 [Bacteroidia bacterium]|nr:hypothetical protein [Bacteroidia bacterium]
MKSKIYIIFSFIIAFAPIKGQVIKQNLLLANSALFHQSIYTYGFEQSKNNLLFKCYSYNYRLQIKDSVTFSLGKHTPSDFLEISIDTLHDVLNFYFQLANQKNLVTLLRLNDTLEKITSAENYDANHINSLTAFDDEKYAYKDDIYVIKTNSDSSGKQFYLVKYHIKTMDKPFEYDSKWQFAFERKHIHRASVVYADTGQVILYTHVSDGIKKGQWILRINANNGEIIKGTKLSAKGDTRHFLLSNLIIDKKNKSINVIGSIYNANEIDFKNNASNFTNQIKNHKLFLVTIDSLGDVINRTEKLLPLPIIVKSLNVPQSYHVKIREFKKLNDSNFDVWMDIYTQSKPLTFCYYSSWHLDISSDDIDFTVNPSKFYISSESITDFISYAKGDSYSKFILNDINEYDKFKYQQPLNQFIIATGLDDLSNSWYMLKKTDLNSLTKFYYYVFYGKKGLENKVVLKAEQNQKTHIYFYKKTSYLSFTTDAANTSFELKVNTL